MGQEKEDERSWCNFGFIFNYACTNKPVITTTRPTDTKPTILSTTTGPTPTIPATPSLSSIPTPTPAPTQAPTVPSVSTVPAVPTTPGSGYQTKCCVSISSKLKDGKELAWTEKFTSGSGSSSSTPTSVILAVSDDKHCGGTEGEPSKGSVVSSFEVIEEFKMKFDGKGAGEADYEKFTLNIDGGQLFQVTASTGEIDGVPCELGTCNMCPVTMEPVYHTFTTGQHQIEVLIDTIDHNYQKNVHFELTFTQFIDGCDQYSCIV